MKSPKAGVTTSAVEVTNISPNGVWLFVGAEELFMPFEQFPWFRNASVVQVLNVESPSPGHLFWPQLDVDVEIASIRQPSNFPLIAKSRSS